MSDLISRQAAIDAIKRIRDDCFPEWTKGAINEITKTTKNDCIEELQHLPSAHPEFDEWCTDCKEYDKEHHRCPRWNRVIRNTIDDLKTQQPVPQWIPFETIPMTEEERKEMSEKYGYELEGYDAVWYVSQLPENGQEVLVCNKYGRVWIDTFNNDIDYGCSLDENGDLDGVVAWMPLPDPWKGGEK